MFWSWCGRMYLLSLDPFLGMFLACQLCGVNHKETEKLWTSGCGLHSKQRRHMDPHQGKDGFQPYLCNGHFCRRKQWQGMTGDGRRVVIHFTSQILLGKPPAHWRLLILCLCAWSFMPKCTTLRWSPLSFSLQNIAPVVKFVLNLNPILYYIAAFTVLHYQQISYRYFLFHCSYC